MTAMAADPAAVEAAILRLASEAGANRSISPMDAARTLADDDKWQALLPAIRRAAIKLALEGHLVIYRKGKPVDPNDFKGVYRLGLPRPPRDPAGKPE
jgi:hypothetical protein